MPKTFLYENVEAEDQTKATAVERDKVRILVIGRTSAVNRVVLEMSHLGFSDSVEWSKPLPTDRREEAMRVLTRYVFADSSAQRLGEANLSPLDENLPQN